MGDERNRCVECCEPECCCKRHDEPCDNPCGLCGDDGENNIIGLLILLLVLYCLFCNNGKGRGLLGGLF